MTKSFKSRIVMWITVLAAAMVVVGSTLAMMVTASNTVQNSFAVADVDTNIDEVLTGGSKQVSIENKGSSAAYVRARILVSGVAPDNVKIVDEEPTDDLQEGCVYLVMQNGEVWQREGETTPPSYSDDFYYYLNVLPAQEGKTPNLLEKVVLAPDLQNEEFLANFAVTIYHESVLAIDQNLSGDAAAKLQTIKDNFEAATVNANG